ncbi:MAG: hypothetical protein RL136_1209 [Planctomycetota bacterium]|jgi:hypothetical protein
MMGAAPVPRVGVRALLASVCIAGILLAACGPRVEYRVRPGFATKQDVPDEIVLEDGTIVRYLELGEYLAMKRQQEGGGRVVASGDPQSPARRPFSMWDELEDGTVRMAAERNDQVVVVAMRAFREERYGELWDQMVARGVRERAAREGEPPIGPEKARERFIEWCAKWRTEVMTLLNRMSFAFSSNSVVFDPLGRGAVRMRLAPQIKGDFRFRSVEVYAESTPDGTRCFLVGIK